MLAKLSFRNAKRQAHDYIIYFVTLTAIFSLIHGLNSLLFAEDDIFPLDDSTFILPMILISSLLFSISLWLTSYMTNFILKRRSKEISIYITLGMEPYQISKVFTLENFYISIFALILLVEERRAGRRVRARTRGRARAYCTTGAAARRGRPSRGRSPAR